tara:strand:- start:2798 stop:3622 length:825 start_codon:yes stop_codon:yes gene_type:complete
MANFGQMLAAAQAYATPQAEQKKAQSDAEKSERVVGKEKIKQKKELEALMELMAKEAEKKKGGFLSNLGGVGKLISAFMPGVGAALSGLAEGDKARAQKKGLEAISSDARLRKYGGTWLSDPTEAFKKQTSDLADEIDPLSTALTTGAMDFGMGKAMGGVTDSLFKGQGAQLAESTMEGFKAGEGLGGLDVTNIVSGLQSDAGPMKNLMANIKEFGGGIGEGSVKGLFEGMDMKDILKQLSGTGAGATQLQAILEMLQNQGDETVSFNAGDYFT